MFREMYYIFTKISKTIDGLLYTCFNIEQFLWLDMIHNWFLQVLYEIEFWFRPLMTSYDCSKLGNVLLHLDLLKRPLLRCFSMNFYITWWICVNEGTINGVYQKVANKNALRMRRHKLTVLRRIFQPIFLKLGIWFELFNWTYSQT